MVDIVILIRAYKSKFLPLAIKSALNQCYRDYNILVLNVRGREDQESKKIDNIVKRFSGEKIKYIKLEKDTPPAYALWIGAKHCEGEFLALLDDDDILLPESLSINYSYFKNNNNNTQLVSGATCVINTQNSILYRVYRPYKVYKSSIQSFKKNIIFPRIDSSSYMIKKNSVLNISKDFYSHIPLEFAAEDVLIFLELLGNNQNFILHDRLIALLRYHRQSRTYVLTINNTLLSSIYQLYNIISVPVFIRILRAFNFIIFLLRAALFLRHNELKFSVVLFMLVQNCIKMIENILKINRK